MVKKYPKTQSIAASVVEASILLQTVNIKATKVILVDGVGGVMTNIPQPRSMNTNITTNVAITNHFLQ